MIQEGTDLISAYCTRLNSMRSAAILDKGKYSYVFRAYSSGEIMFQFVRPALEKIRKCQGESDFSFAPLVRILYLDEEKFEEEARQNIVQCKQEIVDAFAAFPFWPSAQEAKPMNSIVFWSENHLFMTLGAAFLYQQYLETKGMRENIEERSFESQLLLTYLRVHNQQSVAGIYEVNSHVYLPYTLCALLNLFDFSSCQEIKAESFALIGKIVRHMMLCTDPLYGVANLSGKSYI